LAVEQRETHSGQGGRCRLCGIPWPCPAYRLAQTVIAEKTRRQPVIDRAAVHPHWLAGDESTDGRDRP